MFCLRGWEDVSVSKVLGVQSLGLMGKAAERGSICHRLSAGQAEACGPSLLASQPSLFGELQASGGLLLKTNKQTKNPWKPGVVSWLQCTWDVAQW